MRALIPLFALLFLSGCVATSADLRDLADRVRAEVSAGAEMGELLSVGLESLADEVDERTEATAEGISGLKEGGIFGLLGAVGSAIAGTNMLRNRARRRRNEVTGATLARASPPTAPPAA